jgi:hypothetical protein
MMRSLVEKYRKGMITDDHLVVECLHMLDPEDPSLVLSSLPEPILRRTLDFAKKYLAGTMLTNYGLLPARDQVLAAQSWIERFFQRAANKTA